MYKAVFIDETVIFLGCGHLEIPRDSNLITIQKRTLLD
jgi:hypothetical protein